jgi:hypothetical protein
MPNYQNGKIYSIRSRSRPDLIYVGSTVRPLSERFGEHKKSSNVCRSRQIVDIGDSYIELIENYPCLNKEELCRREGEVMRTLDCVNRSVAGRTSAEYRQDNAEHIKQYLQDNAEHISALGKQYYQNNKEHISALGKQYKQDNAEHISALSKQNYQDRKNMQTCICGTMYNYGNKRDRNRHYRSEKHSNFVRKIIEKLQINNY